MKYPCIPKWLIPNQKDEFNYKLQTKEEIEKQLADWKQRGISLQIETFRRYFVDYHTKPLSRSNDNRSECVKLLVNMRNLPFAPLQKRRLEYLVGPRMKNGILKISCKRHPKFEQNIAKAHEILKETLIESLRAPQTLVDEIKNPYLKDNRKAKRHKAWKKKWTQEVYDSYREPEKKTPEEIEHEKWFNSLPRISLMGLNEEKQPSQQI